MAHSRGHSRPLLHFCLSCSIWSNQNGPGSAVFCWWTQTNGKRSSSLHHLLIRPLRDNACCARQNFYPSPRLVKGKVNVSVDGKSILLHLSATIEDAGYSWPESWFLKKDDDDSFLCACLLEEKIFPWKKKKERLDALNSGSALTWNLLRVLSLSHCLYNLTTRNHNNFILRAEGLNRMVPVSIHQFVQWIMIMINFECYCFFFLFKNGERWASWRWLPRFES